MPTCPLAVDVLTDLVRRPLLRASDLDLERNVVLEEINRVEDTPDDLVFELHAPTLWPEHPYGYSILGTPGHVWPPCGRRSQACTGAGYYRGNCVVAAAGTSTTASCSPCSEREGWFEGSVPSRPAPEWRPLPAVRGADLHRASGHRADHIVLRHRHLPLPRSAPVALLPS